MLHISAVQEVTDELEQAVEYLLPQLSRSAPPLSRSDLEEIVSGEATTLLVARDDALSPEERAAITNGAGQQARPQPATEGSDNPDGPIVGMLTLVTFRLPTGVRSWVEDVVTDTNLRGRGTASALIKAAIDLASSAGARTVDLTSRPSREAANRLYVRVGFKLRETNVYRYSLEP